MIATLAKTTHWGPLNNTSSRLHPPYVRVNTRVSCRNICTPALAGVCVEYCAAAVDRLLEHVCTVHAAHRSLQEGKHHVHRSSVDTLVFPRDVCRMCRQPEG